MNRAILILSVHASVSDMEGTPDAGSKVKDERSDEDDITVVEDEDEGREKEAGGSSDGASTKNKVHLG